MVKDEMLPLKTWKKGKDAYSQKLFVLQFLASNKQ